jgi:acyl-CoA synthetase (AMP-forming)/AMP-acid ligase II
VQDQGVTQAFGSPAIWNRVGRYCERQGVQFPSIKRVLSAGAPVPIHVLERMTRALPGPEADIHTPYGATESLPICSINGREVLERTASRTRQGAGTCVGHRFPQITVKIVEITDGPISSLQDVRELPPGEIGEIVVQGPVVTREYFRDPEATARAKIGDGEGFWHRMGDVGYLDDDDALWFCGRKAHIVQAEHGRMFTIPCEAIFNEHPRVYRCALVGVGRKPRQQPVIIIEPEADHFPTNDADRQTFRRELQEMAIASPLTERIETILFHRSLPVDVRHNVKIFREKLAPWAEEQVRKKLSAISGQQEDS